MLHEANISFQDLIKKKFFLIQKHFLHQNPRIYASPAITSKL